MDEKEEEGGVRKKINKKKDKPKAKGFVGLNYLSLEIETRPRALAETLQKHTEHLPPASGHQKIRPEVKVGRFLLCKRTWALPS